MNGHLTNEQLARALDKTALRSEYNGYALTQALHAGGHTTEEVNCLKRWLTGYTTNTDHLTLQTIANKFRTGA